MIMGAVPLLLLHHRQKIGDHGTEAIKFVRLAGGGCWSYGTKYVLGTMLTIVASANVVIINFGLKARYMSCLFLIV